MQKTRQKILEYLKERGEATVDTLSVVLDHLTPVTVRHHLDVLRSEGLVEAPEIRHRSSPGRPRYAYRLTAKAEGLFPGNVDVLTNHLLSELKSKLDENEVITLFENVADRMAQGLPSGPEGESLEQRLDRVVAHLSAHGYMASWEVGPEGYLLHTYNCPYHNVAGGHSDLCMLDLRYISGLLGIVPRRTAHMLEGASVCSYVIPLDAVPGKQPITSADG